MKLSKGMFIRTPLGINKILEQNNDFSCCFYIQSESSLVWHEELDYFSIDGECFDKDEIKANYKLEDLVEAGDLMYIDVSPDNYGGIVVPRVAETQNELDKWKQRFASGECILKGVLTKEQIVSNWYLLGD